nr:hypothetical protein [uncultured bacterium]
MCAYGEQWRWIVEIDKGGDGLERSVQDGCRNVELASWMWSKGCYRLILAYRYGL